MKKVLLIIGAMVATSYATAQNHHIQRHHHGDAEPTVYIISVSETDTIACPTQGCDQQSLAMKNEAVKSAIEDHKTPLATVFSR